METLLDLPLPDSTTLLTICGAFLAALVGLVCAIVFQGSPTGPAAGDGGLSVWADGDD